MSIRRDNIRRRSFSYKMKRWFWSNHTKEVKTIGRVIGEFILSLVWFGLIFVVPHFFH